MSKLTAPNVETLGFLIDLLVDISISMLFSCFAETSHVLLVWSYYLSTSVLRLRVSHGDVSEVYCSV